ncbi:unnamed protein product [Symbiodinium sp. CCMP2592]|nr:unnamed protein product [Symbiodinium sp. CCMP2592]
MCNPEEDGSDDGKSYETQPFFIPKVLKASGTLVIERLPLFFEGYTYAYGHIAYIHGRPPSPVILVHPNYAGLKQFDIDQAAFLARAGYVGVAVDLYREREMVGVSDESLEYLFEDRDPKRDLTFFGQSSGYMSERQKEKVKRHSAGSFAAMTGLLKTPIVWRALMAAWLDKARCHPAVHRDFAGAIGYCFGGQAVLEQVRAGHSIQAAVTFHGLLHSRPRRVESVRGNGYDGRMSAEEFAADSSIKKAPNVYSTKCKVLIENGDLDDHVPAESVQEFRSEMDAIGIDWRIHTHAQTPHGFALAPGVWSTAYRENADRRSTLSMLQLFAEVWPEFPQPSVPTNACGTVLGQAIRIAAPDRKTALQVIREVHCNVLPCHGYVLPEDGEDLEVSKKVQQMQGFLQSGKVDLKVAEALDYTVLLSGYGRLLSKPLVTPGSHGKQKATAVSQRALVVLSEDSQQAVRETWTHSHRPPKSLWVASTWNKFEPKEMKWDGSKFYHAFQVGANGWESFQLLIDGRWEQCVYPSVADACPFVEYRLLGPDNRGHGKNWTVGRHPEDSAKTGERVRLAVAVNSQGLPRQVSWRKEVRRTPPQR